MRLRPILKALLCALTAVLAAPLPVVHASNKKADTTAATPAPLVWKLESVKQVGGHPAEVLGSPQVVEEDGRKAIVFNGSSDGLILPVNPLAGWARFTVEVLIKPDPTGPEEQRFIHIQDSQGRRAMVETRMTRDRQWVLDTYLRANAEHNRVLIDRTKTHPPGQWHWVALTYDGEIMTSYINGTKELDGEVLLPPMVGGVISIGVRQNKVSWYKGAIREIRFCPVALQPEALQRVRR